MYGNAHAKTGLEVSFTFFLNEVTCMWFVVTKIVLVWKKKKSRGWN